ncbi:MAG: hypothetical protein ACMUIE_04290 [Thermoplasmatota archaeon]
MNGDPVGQILPEEVIIRLRAKMEDNSYNSFKEGGRCFLAFRVPGEKIDLLRSLEYMAEFMDEEDMESAEKVILISDRNYEMTPAEVIGPKMETKKRDDEKLYGELKEKLSRKMEPLVFTIENDILELYRIAIRMDGSINRTDSSVGLDLIKVELPKEGEVIYLIFDDGYRKLARGDVSALADNAMSGLRMGPALAKDPAQTKLGKLEGMDDRKSGPSTQEKKGIKGGPEATSAISRKEQELARDDPKVLLRDLAKKIVPLGYRQDTLFSRKDVNQLFFVGMSGPALFVKILSEREELPSFLRVLEHRKDALGVLITKDWHPDIEALSRIRGFIYLDWRRAWRADEVIGSVVKGGGI